MAIGYSRELSAVDLTPLAKETSLVALIDATDAVTSALGGSLAVDTGLETLLTAIDAKLGGSLSVEGSSVTLSGSLALDDSTPLSVATGLDITDLATKADIQSVVGRLSQPLSVEGSSVTLSGSLALDEPRPISPPPTVCTTVASTVILAPVTGQQYALCFLRIQSALGAAPTEVLLKDSLGTLVARVPCPAEGTGTSDAYTHPIRLPIGAGLSCELSTASNVLITPHYWVEDSNGDRI